jgi:hypothetical protein
MKLGSIISGSQDPHILHVKINPEIVELARLQRVRPIDIMNNPASLRPLRYMLKDPNVIGFYAWPFPTFSDTASEVDFFEYHGYLALLSLTPGDVEKLLEEDPMVGDGVY